MSVINSDFDSDVTYCEFAEGLLSGETQCSIHNVTHRHLGVLRSNITATNFTNVNSSNNEDLHNHISKNKEIILNNEYHEKYEHSQHCTNEKKCNASKLEINIDENNISHNEIPLSSAQILEKLFLDDKEYYEKRQFSTINENKKNTILNKQSNILRDNFSQETKYPHSSMQNIEPRSDDSEYDAKENMLQKESDINKNIQRNDNFLNMSENNICVNLCKNKPLKDSRQIIEEILLDDNDCYLKNNGHCIINNKHIIPNKRVKIMDENTDSSQNKTLQNNEILENSFLNNNKNSNEIQQYRNINVKNDKKITNNIDELQRNKISQDGVQVIGNRNVGVCKTKKKNETKQRININEINNKQSNIANVNCDEKRKNEFGLKKHKTKDIAVIDKGLDYDTNLTIMECNQNFNSKSASIQQTVFTKKQKIVNANKRNKKNVRATLDKLNRQKTDVNYFSGNHMTTTYSGDGKRKKIINKSKPEWDKNLELNTVTENKHIAPKNICYSLNENIAFRLRSRTLNTTVNGQLNESVSKSRLNDKVNSEISKFKTRNIKNMLLDEIYMKSISKDKLNTDNSLNKGSVKNLKLKYPNRNVRLENNKHYEVLRGTKKKLSDTQTTTGKIKLRKSKLKRNILTDIEQCYNKSVLEGIENNNVESKSYRIDKNVNNVLESSPVRKLNDRNVNIKRDCKVIPTFTSTQQLKQIKTFAVIDNDSFIEAGKCSIKLKKKLNSKNRNCLPYQDVKNFSFAEKSGFGTSERIRKRLMTNADFLEKFINTVGKQFYDLIIERKILAIGKKVTTLKLLEPLETFIRSTLGVQEDGDVNKTENNTHFHCSWIQIIKFSYLFKYFAEDGDTKYALFFKMFAEETRTYMKKRKFSKQGLSTNTEDKWQLSLLGKYMHAILKNAKISHKMLIDRLKHLPPNNLSYETLYSLENEIKNVQLEFYDVQSCFDSVIGSEINSADHFKKNDYKNLQIGNSARRMTARNLNNENRNSNSIVKHFRRNNQKNDSKKLNKKPIINNNKVENRILEDTIFKTNEPNSDCVSGNTCENINNDEYSLNVNASTTLSSDEFNSYIRNTTIVKEQLAKCNNKEIKNIERNTRNDEFKNQISDVSAKINQHDLVNINNVTSAITTKINKNPNNDLNEQRFNFESGNNKNDELNYVVNNEKQKPSHISFTLPNSSTSYDEIITADIANHPNDNRQRKQSLIELRPSILEQINHRLKQKYNDKKSNNRERYRNTDHTESILVRSNDVAITNNRKQLIEQKSSTGIYKKILNKPRYSETFINASTSACYANDEFNEGERVNFNSNNDKFSDGKTVTNFEIPKDLVMTLNKKSLSTPRKPLLFGNKRNSLITSRTILKNAQIEAMRLPISFIKDTNVGYKNDLIKKDPRYNTKIKHISRTKNEVMKNDDIISTNKKRPSFFYNGEYLSDFQNDDNKKTKELQNSHSEIIRNCSIKVTNKNLGQLTSATITNESYVGKRTQNNVRISELVQMKQSPTNKSDHTEQSQRIHLIEPPSFCFRSTQFDNNQTDDLNIRNLLKSFENKIIENQKNEFNNDDDDNNKCVLPSVSRRPNNFFNVEELAEKLDKFSFIDISDDINRANPIDNNDEKQKAQFSAYVNSDYLLEQNKDEIWKEISKTLKGITHVRYRGPLKTRKTFKNE